ncbi:hypothetical protein [Mycobacterium sp. 050134]|uniref:hypothetical protein n=1 Tax=Mycobacterium sp. 050134 TaxID=3096111 RepID=UPI002ED9C187
MTERGRHARTIDEGLAAAQADTAGREAALPFDPELVRLVQFINAVDTAEVGLTLHVKGCVVSGMLISAARYYRLLVDEFSGPNHNGEGAAAFADFYRPALEKVEEAIASQTLEKRPDLPRHIHFRRAQTVINGQGSFTRSLWRGRLTEVDGWSFGNFGPISRLDHAMDL